MSESKDMNPMQKIKINNLGQMAVMPEKFKKVYINSKHRDIGGTPTDFSYLMPESIENVIGVSAYNVIIANSFRNVDDSNNKLRISHSSGGLANIVLPIGYYDFKELSIELETLIDNASIGTGVTITTDPTTKVFTITAVSGTLSIHREGTTMERQLGLWNAVNATYWQQNEGIIVSDGIWDLSGRKSIFLLAPGLPISNFLNQQKMPVLTKILIDKALGDRVHSAVEDRPSDMISLPKPFTLQRLNFRLTDEDGQLVDNGDLDWEFSLVLRIAP
jgi:hypothetical protein